MRSSLLSVAVLACVAGCGSQDEGPPLVPAAGVLTYQGRPLEGYEVFLQPGDPQQTRARGVTDAQGQFVLGTGGGEGAPAGTYRAYIVKEMPPLEGEPGRETPGAVTAPRSVLPAKYEDPDTAGLEVTIPEQGNESIELAL